MRQPVANWARPLWEQTIGLHLQARRLGGGGVPPQVLLAELPTAALGMAGAVLGRRRAPTLALAGVMWSTLAVLVLAVHRPLWQHHLLVLAAPLALLAGCTVFRLPHLGSRGLVLAAAGIALASAASALQVYQGQTPDESRMDAVNAERAATGAGDLTITDDQYTVSLSGRRTPPSLVDTSQVRARSGELTTPQVARAAERWSVSCVLVDDHYGSLSTMPGFHQWVTHRYPVIRRLGHGRTLYLREPCRHHPRSSCPTAEPTLDPV